MDHIALEFAHCREVRQSLLFYIQPISCRLVVSISVLPFRNRFLVQQLLFSLWPGENFSRKLWGAANCLPRKPFVELVWHSNSIRNLWVFRMQVWRWDHTFLSLLSFVLNSIYYSYIFRAILYWVHHWSVRSFMSILCFFVQKLLTESDLALDLIWDLSCYSCDRVGQESAVVGSLAHVLLCLPYMLCDVVLGFSEWWKVFHLNFGVYGLPWGLLVHHWRSCW